MNQKKIRSTLVIGIMLVSLASIAIPVSAGFHRVSGYLYIDDEIAPASVEVTLSFDEEDLTDNTNENGHYQIDFTGHDGETGYFTVTYDGADYVPTPDYVDLEEDLAYSIDLYIYTEQPVNNPPDKPSTPSPENNSINVNLNPTLSVYASDPDEDTMNISFYNASDDSLIDIATNVANGSTALVDWPDLSYNTTYYWYAVANDSQFETRSDTWQFTTKKKENIAPKVEIIKPERAVYINNVKKLPRLFRIALIIGDITIIANATDEDSGIEKVEFYINGKLKGNDTTEPYTYNWTRDRLRLVHIFCIKVVAYDNDGATAEDCMIVRKFL